MDEQPSLQDVADAVTDLGRVVARQGASLDRLVDDSRAAASRDRDGADLPLLVELFALYRDVLAFALTSRTKRERTAFETQAAGLERLIVGRGGQLVTPGAAARFDPSTMEAVTVVDCEHRDDDRTVDELLEPGLALAATGRSVRPARVAVRRFRG